MMKKTIMTSLILLSLIVLATCGGSGSSPDTPTDIPIAIEGIDGETGVSVSASFVYTFDTAPDSSTVTSDTFFIYPTNLTQADKVDATISASTDVEYILDPSADLEDDTLYGIVVRLTQITDAAGNPLGTVDVMIIFSTGDEAIPSFVGTLDTTFASPDGYITGSALGGFNNDYNIVLDSNENVYYMESYTDPKGFIIRKYDNQGNVDTTFASLGTLDQTGDGNRIRIMLIDNDFIFLVGKYEEDSVVIFKYNTDGIQVDSASYAVPTGGSAESAAVNSEGDIIVVGYVGDVAIPDVSMTIWKYTSDLQLDTSFGTNGVVTHNDGANYTAGSEIVLDSADDIYVGGAETSTDFSDYDAHVWKYTSNGTIMNSFGASGEIDMGSTDLGRMYMDSSNNLFVGLVDDWDSCAITSRIIKYDTDGNLDTNFGSSGIFNFENKNAGAGGFATDSDGNLLVSSYICTGSVTSDAVIWILDSDTGELITVSGSGGKFIFSTLETPSLRNIVIDSEGRAVTCGVNNEGVLVADEPPYFIMRVR